MIGAVLSRYIKVFYSSMMEEKVFFKFCKCQQKVIVIIK